MGEGRGRREGRGKGERILYLELGLGSAIIFLSVLVDMYCLSKSGFVILPLLSIPLPIPTNPLQAPSTSILLLGRQQIFCRLGIPLNPLPLDPVENKEVLSLKNCLWKKPLALFRGIDFPYVLVIRNHFTRSYGSRCQRIRRGSLSREEIRGSRGSGLRSECSEPNPVYI